MQVLIFGDNILYRYGGAEKSAYLLTDYLQRLCGLEVRVISGRSDHLDKNLDKYPYKNIEEMDFFFNRQFPYFKYWVNSIIYKRNFKKKSSGLLLAQSSAAPMAINSFNGPSVYFVRDELSLNINRCYEKRLKKRIKFSIRRLIDYPFFMHYSAENRKAMGKANLIVANSRYMADRVRQEFGCDKIIALSTVDIGSLDSIKTPPVSERPYITLVGSSEVKGISIFKRIARLLPRYKFLLIGRSYSHHTEGNITYHGFVNDIVELFRKTRILLVPSVWIEAFGRVSVEAQALGIPVIVSRRGGLPETVPSAEYTVSDYRNADVWIKKILWVLDDYENHSKKAREYIAKFGLDKQMETLFKAIYDATGLRLK
ncbi:MAG: glycosyltransferase family 4 protein [Candidatus Omnitrophica bacterium]|nr:glycosyltransferase family 4 protein [Candidatus Omnitrophota bacterium]